MSLIGPNATNFLIEQGEDGVDKLAIAAKSKADLMILYKSNSLQSSLAYLLLVGKKQSSLVAQTLVFKLQANIDTISPKVTALSSWFLFAHKSAQSRFQSTPSPSKGLKWPFKRGSILAQIFPPSFVLQFYLSIFGPNFRCFKLLNFLTCP